jgi:hypothetical protein
VKELMGKQLNLVPTGIGNNKNMIDMSAFLLNTRERSNLKMHSRGQRALRERFVVSCAQF